jgi:hypothetical protein
MPKMVGINTMGKPTERTGVPQPKLDRRHQVLDGIVKGVPRGTMTPLVDGLITGTKAHMGQGEGFVHSTAPSATRKARQNFGSTPYAMGQLGSSPAQKPQAERMT